MNTFFRYCVYISLCLIIFNLCVNFVGFLGVFDYNPVVGMGGGSASDVFNNTTNVASTTETSGNVLFGMDALWFTMLSVTGILSLAMVAVTRSTTPIAIYVFSAVFWTSYNGTISILDDLMIPGDFILIGTAGMLFMWSAAVVGMLSGSG